MIRTRMYTSMWLPLSQVQNGGLYQDIKINPLITWSTQDIFFLKTNLHQDLRDAEFLMVIQSHSLALVL